MAGERDTKPVDLLGREFTSEERTLLEAYRRLRDLLAHELPPVARANLEEAVSALWLAVSGLALSDDPPRR